MASSSLAPAEFRHAVAELRAVRIRREILLDEIPGPRRPAPYSYALGASVHPEGRASDPHYHGDQDEPPAGKANGRLILLHDPEGPEAWNGTFRLVTHVTAHLTDDEAADARHLGRGWDEFLASLRQVEAEFSAPSGTVTRSTSTGFGGLAGVETSHELELRASWTPVGDVFSPHLAGWCAFLGHLSELPSEA